MTQPTEIPQNPVAKTKRFFKRHVTPKGRQEDRERKQSAAVAAREVHEQDKRDRLASGKKNGAIREAIVEPFALAFRQRRILKAMRDNDLTAADGQFVRDAAHSFRGRKAHRTAETDKVDVAHKGIKEIAQGKRGETDAHRTERKRLQQIISVEGKGFAGDLQKEVIKPLLEDPTFAAKSPADRLQAIQQRIQQFKGTHPEYGQNRAVKDLIETSAQIQDTAHAVGALIDQLNQAAADPAARLQALDQYIIQHGLGKGLFGREKNIYSMQRTEAFLRLAGFSKFAVAAAITAASGGWAAPVSTYVASALIGYVTNLHRLNYEEMMYNLERTRGRTSIAGVDHIKTESMDLTSIATKKGFKLEDRSRHATYLEALKRGAVNALFGSTVGLGLHFIGETPIGQIAGEKVSEGLHELGQIRPVDAALKDVRSLEDLLGKLNPFDHHGAPKGPVKPGSGGGKGPEGGNSGNGTNT
ncbi:MAG: hypothetical protein KGJ07_07930, partial [Patescibacteria group bacterium]|nr:hypothetical protein [Patescibacteria group bacterium]